jgi:hypothetical protein
MMRRWLRPLLVFALLIIATAGVGLRSRAQDRSGAEAAGSPTAMGAQQAPALATGTSPAMGGASPSLALQVAAPVAATVDAPVTSPGMPGPMAPPDRPLAEVHWQGIEVIPLTPRLARELSAAGGGSAIPAGVVVDQVTSPADVQGFAGGDIITRIAGVGTPDLPTFLAATDRVRDQTGAVVDLDRQGRPLTMVLSAARLGTANGETPPAIPPDAKPPHGCARAHAALLHMDTLGPCSRCHLIRQGPQPPTDLVQLLPEPPQAAQPLDPACLIP